MASKKSTIVLGVVALVAAVSVAGYVSGEAAAPQARETVDERPSEIDLEQETPRNGTAEPSEAVIEQRALRSNTTVESVVGTVTITTERGNETQTMRAHVWQEPPNDVRFEYASGPAEGNVVVSNGSTFWLYNESTSTVQRFQYQTGLLEGLTGAIRTLSPQYTAEYQGRANVSGQETYVVSLDPPEGPLDRVLGNGTVWLDQDNWFPVQQQVTTTVGNRTSTTTITYSNLTYNATIPTDRFTFEPPENATVVDVGLPQTSTFGSVEAAESAVNFTIREPQSLPDGYQLTTATVVQTGNTTSVSLTYGNGSETLRFSQSTADRTTTRGGNVSVAGHAGSYREIGNRGVLQWQTDGFTYSVAGPATRSLLLDVAESIED